MGQDLFGWDDNDIESILDAYTVKTTPAPEVDDDDFDDDCIAGCDGSTNSTGKHTVECNAAYFKKYPAGKSSLDSFGFSKWAGHNHNQNPITLSDGTVILASSSQRHSIEDAPDLGVYLDGCWKPSCVAFHVGWQDYGLPYLSDESFRIVVETALETARAGKRVEVGCIGGHGRTGTMLAVLECFTMERADADAAIKKIRAEHCDRAIETKDQEWFVAKWAAILNGEEIPAMPVKVAPKALPAPAKKATAKKVVAPKKAKHRKAGTSRFNNNSRKGK